MRSVVNESQVYPKRQYAWTDRTGITQPDFTGTGAAALAVITASVVSTTQISGGSGYTSAPTVSWIGGGSGTGLVMTAVVSGGSVTAVNVVSGGSLFTGPPTLVFTGGGGTGANFTANMGPYHVTSVTPTAGGQNYYAAPQVTLTGGGGTGAAWNAVVDPLSHTVFDYVQVSRGTPYTSAPAVVLQNIPLVLSGISPLPTYLAGNLVVTADSTVAGAMITLALALWDERGKPISLVFNTITTSDWVTNRIGTYIAASPLATELGYLSYDISHASWYRIFVMEISSGVVNLHSRLF